MKLTDIIARPHPSGNRIDLFWINPEPDLFPKVRIIRKEKTYPLTLDDGLSLAEIETNLIFSSVFDEVLAADLDTKIIPDFLRDLFSKEGICLSSKSILSIISPSKKWLITDRVEKFFLKLENNVISTFRQNIFQDNKDLKSETFYYYGLFLFNKNSNKYETDITNRTSAMAIGCYDMSGQMYELLPRIYHRYDTVLSDKVIDADKNKGELLRFLDIPGSQLDQLYSYARALLHIRKVNTIDGTLLPLLGQWIGWKTDTRLEIDRQRNDISAAPYLYHTVGLIPNVEAMVKRISGRETRTKEFVHNIFLTNNPEKLNLWIKENTDEVKWSEPVEPFSLDYAYDGRPAFVTEGNITWLFYHTIKKHFRNNEKTFTKDSEIWCKNLKDGHWSPSQALTDPSGINKNPSVAIHNNTLVVFWNRYDETARSWCIEYYTRSDEIWSKDEKYANPFEDNLSERRNPLACTDENNQLWLFWLEKTNGGWSMKYNRHNRSSWQSPVLCPVNEAIEDPFVLYYSLLNRIYIFWTRRNGEGKRTIAFTFFKIEADLLVWDSTIQTMPKDADYDDKDYNDKDPSALVKNGDIEVFWSSDRKGSYSIWKSIFTPEPFNWDGIQQVTSNHYSQRYPLPVDLNGTTTLFYRSNESVPYLSEVYKATDTVDFRYAGSLLADTRNVDKNSLKGEFQDFQAYTYDTGKNNDDWYSREVAGIYIIPGSDDPNLLKLNKGIIRQLLREIMPIQVRPEFIIDTATKESVFPEGFPADKFLDGFICPSKDIYPKITESATDTIPDWKWLRTVLQKDENLYYLDNRSVDFTPVPVDSTYRTWHIGLKEEE